MTTKQTHQVVKQTASMHELEKERLAIQDLLTKGEDEHWQIGVHYNRIVNGHLVEKSREYKSSREFFAKQFGDVPQSTLSLYGAIARRFAEVVAKKYGVFRLRALLTYEKLTGSKLPEGDPAATPIRIPQKDGSTKEKPFADCTRDELQAAIRHHRENDGPPPDVDPYDKKILDALRKAIRNIEGDPPYIDMKTIPDQHWKAVVDFRVPVEKLEDLYDSLDAALGKQGTHPADNAGWNPNWKKVKKLGKVLGKYFDGPPKGKGAARRQTRHRAHARS
jgi:hypothetical protein